MRQPSTDARHANINNAPTGGANQPDPPRALPAFTPRARPTAAGRASPFFHQTQSSTPARQNRERRRPPSPPRPQVALSGRSHTNPKP